MPMTATSIEAYYSIQKCSARKCLEVRQYVEANPGSTNEDIATALNMKIQSVTPRTRELKVNGLLWITGKEKTASGRNGYAMSPATCPNCMSTKLEVSRESEGMFGYYCFTCGHRFRARLSENSELEEVIDDVQ